MAQLSRCLGIWDVVLLTIGAVVGSGIFRVPSVVAQHAQTPELILFVWVAGGLIALSGALVFGELGARVPAHGGLYAYLRDAYHPAVGFAFGWMSLIVSSGTAAAALTFATYFQALTGITMQANVIAALALLAITAINCLGCRQGTNSQNILVVLKIAAVASLIGFGLFVHPAYSGASPTPALAARASGAASAMIPVLFAYVGWQSATYLAGEMKNPGTILPLGLFIGVATVAAIYILVNVVSLHALGARGLAASDAPASAILNLALGPIGKQAISLLVVISTLGLICNNLLAKPRLYHAMAEDGTLFDAIAWINPRTRAPVIAILLQGSAALLLTLSGTYENMIVYSTSLNFLFFGLAGIGLFILRSQSVPDRRALFMVPGHPVTTLLFIAAAFGVVIEAYINDPIHSAIGLALVLCGLPVYALSMYRHRRRATIV
jgi:basic amino acid/polyamine antiporter, APA family